MPVDEFTRVEMSTAEAKAGRQLRLWSRVLLGLLGLWAAVSSVAAFLVVGATAQTHPADWLSAWSTLFHKIHFVTNDDDPREVMVETWPGDLTVHDGRMWHRVKLSSKTGEASLRRSMYIPYVVDAYQPKSEEAPTNLYMRVFDSIIGVKRWWTRRQWERSQARLRG